MVFKAYKWGLLLAVPTGMILQVLGFARVFYCFLFAVRESPNKTEMTLINQCSLADFSASVRQVSGTFISPFALATRPTRWVKLEGKTYNGKVVGTVSNEVGSPAPSPDAGIDSLMNFVSRWRFWIPKLNCSKKDTVVKFWEGPCCHYELSFESECLFPAVCSQQTGSIASENRGFGRISFPGDTVGFPISGRVS